jgi:hypothetical protein
MSDRDDTLYLDGIRTENGQLVIDAHGAEQTLALMALSMRTFFEANADEGTNYIQSGVRHEGKTWNFVVYPAGKPTPHDKRQEAEQSLVRLRAEILELAAELVEDAAARLRALLGADTTGRTVV